MERRHEATAYGNLLPLRFTCGVHATGNLGTVGGAVTTCSVATRGVTAGSAGAINEAGIIGIAELIHSES